MLGCIGSIKLCVICYNNIKFHPWFRGYSSFAEWVLTSYMLYVIIISNFILGLKGTTVLLNGWILPIGEVPSERVGVHAEMQDCCRTAQSPQGVVLNVFQNKKKSGIQL